MARRKNAEQGENRAPRRGKKADKPLLVEATTGQIFEKPKNVADRWLDMYAYLNPVQVVDGRSIVYVHTPDPLEGRPLCPGKTSPLCRQCKLDECGAYNPYIESYGSENPIITIVTDSIVQSQDDYGRLISPSVQRVGGANVIYRLLVSVMDKTGIDPDRDVRWLSITRCAQRNTKKNLSTKAQWCRYHVVQDLRLHPPKLIMPFGTLALGALSHKSNANDWQGKLLTYRGWPDDWLTEAKYMKPRDSMVGDGSQVVGHPLFGELSVTRTMMYPLQSPSVVFAQKNPQVTRKWQDAILEGLEYAKGDYAPLDYNLPWYNITSDPEEVKAWMWHLAHDIPGTLVAFDTETTGLKPYAKGQKIVFLMFRWDDPATGEPRSIGFPWDYPTSPLFAHIKELTPYVLEALYASILCGHNLTFDMLFCAATLDGCDINLLAPQGHYDTWHMAYTSRQASGTLGLERVTYDYVPHLAGYEEDMTLLIQLESETMDPAAGEGGHYAMCPADKWESHLKPYVMGDVETCYIARQGLQEKLDSRSTYDIPLAHPTDHGGFRTFTPPPRAWVYKNIISPSARMLTKLMARGMYIDPAQLTLLERKYPDELRRFRDTLRRETPAIMDWVTQKENTPPVEGEKPWEFDLENKGVLKDLLFTLLNLPIQRLTKQGRALFNDDEDRIAAASQEDKFKYAAVDKFTLNKLAADHPVVRPLIGYRKLYKQYTTYIRPLRNYFDETIDKKHRDKEPHLWLPEDGGDGCLHASFLLTGTRGGRLSCRDPNLQQLPSDSDVKKMFVSRFGERGCIYAGDLSQIELRLLAAACGDPNMLKAYYDDLDLHTLTTSRIFKLPYETFSKDYMAKLQAQGKADEASKLELKRRIGKTCNFLTGYGGGAFGLQTTLANSQIYLPIEECEDILNSFFDSYPTLKKYLSEYKQFVLDNGVAVSLTGRVRIFEEVDSDDNEIQAKALRAGCNHLIQATASDMMLVCLCVIEQAMRDEGLESILVSTVHDSLVIDAIIQELPKVHDIVYTVLNHIPDVLKMAFGDDYDTSWMIVPFAGDCEVGPTYKGLNKIPTKGAIDWHKLLQH